MTAKRTTRGVSTTLPTAARGLTPKQQRFAAEYLVDLNASAAYRRAGYSATGNAAEVNASRLLRNAQVQTAVAAARAKVATKLEISAERVIGEAWRVLTADARELVEHHVGCCRHCWGTNHRRQRTAGELERDRKEHALLVTPLHGAERLPFDEQGGDGFDARREPHPECPECFGRGVGRTYINDTRHLSPAAAALYAGVRQTRDGLEVRMHDKLTAVDKLCRHLGLYDAVRARPEVVQALLQGTTAPLTDQARALLAAGLTGDLSLPQVSQLLAGLGSLAKLTETEDLMRRLEALERNRGVRP